MATKELTAGNPFKLILLFMTPMFLGNIFQQFYNFADALIVGRTLGIKALASIGATTPLIFLVISFIFASTQGFSVITAQKFGARDYLMVRKSLCASIILSFILMIVMTSISAPFAKSVLVLMRVPNDILTGASDYLFIMFIGIFATVFYNLASNIMRALGDSKTPLYFLIFSSILNIILDLIFILEFHLGIKGAGYATVLSQGVSTVLSLIYMFVKFPILRLKKEDWNLDYNFIYEHIKVGIPMGFQMSILSLGVIAVQFVLNSLGSIAIAAYTTAVRADQMFSQSLLALGAACASYTAQNYGAKKMSRIKEGAKAAILIALIISVICLLILVFASTSIISMFMDVPDMNVIRLSKQYLNIVIMFYFFLGTLLVYRNILQGMGNVITPLYSGIAELIARALAAFTLGKWFGYTGICFATPFAWVAGAVVLFLGYKIDLMTKYKKLKTEKEI